MIEKLLSGLEAGSLGPNGFLEASRDLERSDLVERGRTLRLAQALGLASEDEEEHA